MQFSGSDGGARHGRDGIAESLNYSWSKEFLEAGKKRLAGYYGFRQETCDVAMLVGDRAYLPRVRNAGDAWLVADGFSCREQAAQSAGRRPLTLPELLLRGAASRPEGTGKGRKTGTSGDA